MRVLEGEVFRRLRIDRKFWIVEVVTNTKGLFADREANVMLPFNRNISQISKAQLDILDPFRGKWKEGIDTACVIT